MGSYPVPVSFSIVFDEQRSIPLCEFRTDGAGSVTPASARWDFFYSAAKIVRCSGEVLEQFSDGFLDPAREILELLSEPFFNNLFDRSYSPSDEGLPSKTSSCSL